MASLSTTVAAKDRSPGFFDQRLDLPGMPAIILSTDMTGDGLQDLVVLVAYRTWDDVSTVEQTSFDDIEGMVEVMTVVTELLDKRELRVYPGLNGPGFGEPLPALELDTTLHALATGHPSEPLLAITDNGIAAVRGFDQPVVTPALTPILTVETSLSGSGSFYSDVAFLQHLDDDDIPDLLLPTDEGWVTFRGNTGGFDETPTSTLIEPVKGIDEDAAPALSEEASEEAGADSEEARSGEAREGEDSDDPDPDEDTQEPVRRPRRRLPTVRDANGDGLVDLLLITAGRRHGAFVFSNQGGTHFADPVELVLEKIAGRREEIVYIGDLDGDRSPELVTQQETFDDEDAGFKKEIANAKRPHHNYRLYRIDRDLGVASEPHHTFGAIGYTFEGETDRDDDEDVDIRLPGGFQDLDGDGRLDLVAITLDFSLVPMLMRVLITRHISLQMDFHPWCQQTDSTFREVPDLDLSGKFKINLRNVQIRHLSQFAGDFNGDGRSDFVQLGRGKKVTFHFGGPSCTYPRSPDRVLKMTREPKHLGLVRILDLDGDARSDLYVVHPGKEDDSGRSAPVRIDLYLAEDI